VTSGHEGASTIGEAISLNVKPAAEAQAARETQAAGAFGKAQAKKGPAGLFAAFFQKALQSSKESGPAQTKAPAAAPEGAAAKALAASRAGQTPAGARSLPAGGARPEHNPTADTLLAEAGPPRLERSRRPSLKPSAKAEGPGEVAEEEPAAEGPGPRKAKSRAGSEAAAAGAEFQVVPAQTTGAPGEKARRGASKEEGSDPRPSDEDRSRIRSKDDPTLASRIQVNDQRRAQARREQAASVDQTAGVEAGAKGPSHDSAGGSRELVLDLSKPGQIQQSDRPTDAPPSQASASGADFASLLADRLRESGNTEIVQSARIVLKDGDSGSIRMRLNPPELGHVKIELNLADNSISGRIVVESDEAKTAFEKGMADLQDAFRSGGFESARLEVSVGSGGQGGAGSGGDRADEGPFWSERSRSAAIESAAPAFPALAQSRSDRAVDIVV